jgi:hypothetical protein
MMKTEKETNKCVSFSKYILFHSITLYVLFFSCVGLVMLNTEKKTTRSIDYETFSSQQE